MRRLPVIIVSLVWALGCTSQVVDGAGSGGDGGDASGGVDGNAGGGTGGAGIGTGTGGGGVVDGPTGGLSFSVEGNFDLGDTVVLSWPETGAAFSRLVLWQSDVAVTANASGDGHSVRIPGDVDWSYLAELSVGAAEWRVETASEKEFLEPLVAASGTLTLSERFTVFFDAGFGQGFPLSMTGLPHQAAVGTTVQLSGDAGAQGILSSVFIARPDARVDEIVLDEGSKTLPAGAPYAFEYTFDQPGLYAVELLQYNAIPAANTPVYVGGAVPLIPPVMDVEWHPVETQPVPLEEIRSVLLQKVNAARVQAGVPQLVAHPLADQTAQKKAEQLAAAQVLSHGTSGGAVQPFKELALEVGLGGFISENLGVETDLNRLFGALYWSGSHRRGLLDERWRSVGHGAAVFSEVYGQLVFVEHFTSALP